MVTLLIIYTIRLFKTNIFEDTCKFYVISLLDKKMKFIYFIAFFNKLLCNIDFFVNDSDIDFVKNDS